MKKLKKIASLLLALVLALSMMSNVFAAETETGTGTITINGVSEKVTYEIYQLLVLESYDKGSGAYSYKVNSAWTAFFATDDAGYITWTAAEDDDTVAAFAKLALAYAQDNGIDPVQSSENEGEFVITDTSGKFSDLPLGYYLVDSTMGALCGLTTTNPDASINAKNGQPTIDKQVQEDRIYDAETGGNEVKVVKMEAPQNGYRHVVGDEEGVSIVVEDGKVTVVGLDNGTYYLEETVAPAGYNKLTARQKFIISDGNLEAIFNGNIYSTGSGVHVVNKTGTMLPETGGMGTTMFYVIGGILVAAAVVLLITRKRLSRQ